MNTKDVAWGLLRKHLQAAQAREGRKEIFQSPAETVFKQFIPFLKQ